MVADDADYGISHTDLQDTFGEDVTDAIGPRPASENGEPAESRLSKKPTRRKRKKQAAMEHLFKIMAGAATRSGTQRERAPAGERIEPGLPAKQLFVEIGGRRIPKPMTDYAEASRAYVQAIDVTGATQRRDRPAVPPAIIVDSDGKKVASISYNAGFGGRLTSRSTAPTPSRARQQDGRLCCRAPRRGARVSRPSARPNSALAGEGAEAGRTRGLFGDERTKNCLTSCAPLSACLAPTPIASLRSTSRAPPRSWPQQPGIEPEAAFGQAVIKNAVEQGFITEQEAGSMAKKSVTYWNKPRRKAAAHTLSKAAPHLTKSAPAASGGRSRASGRPRSWRTRPRR